jgi:hypothetical protein
MDVMVIDRQLNPENVHFRWKKYDSTATVRSAQVIQILVKEMNKVF